MVVAVFEAYKLSSTDGTPRTGTSLCSDFDRNSTQTPLTQNLPTQKYAKRQVHIPPDDDISESGNCKELFSTEDSW